MSLQENLLHPRPSWLPGALAAIGRHGFLTARQVGTLVHRDQGEVAGAFHALVAEDLLVELTPTHAARSEPVFPAHALTRTGCGVLRSIDDRAPVTVVSPAKSRYILAHDIERNEFGLVLERLAEMGAIVLHRFETAREKIGAVGYVATVGAQVRVPLVADALAVVGVGGETTALLVEVDRGTIGIEKMRTKYRGYLSWFHDNGPRRRFGLRSLRVLTVAPTEARLKRLRAAAVEATDGRGSGLFWFGVASSIDCTAPEKFLSPAFTVARSGEPANERLFA